MNLLTEVVDGHVRGRTHKDLSGVHLGEVVDDRSRRHSLSGTWRALNKRQLLLQNSLDRCHLRVVELGQVGSSKALGHLDVLAELVANPMRPHLCPQNLGLEFMAKKLVVLKVSATFVKDTC